MKELEYKFRQNNDAREVSLLSEESKREEQIDSTQNALKVSPKLKPAIMGPILKYICK